MGLNLLNIEDITERQFQEISTLVKKLAGINLHMGKKELVKARLNKRLRHLGISSYNHYIDYLKSKKRDEEIIFLLDALSTNLTSFFREADHFKHIAKEYLPGRLQSPDGLKKLRMWSAGCSSGEEPYSLAMTVAENVPSYLNVDCKILATDLSTKVLKKAAEGVYPKDRLENIPPLLRSKYFDCIEDSHANQFVVDKKIRSMIKFARLNLMEDWPMRGPFDIILCRNVMIYFEKPTQQKLIERYSNLLRANGLLIIGHSESLTGINHSLKYLKPTIYEKS